MSRDPCTLAPYDALGCLVFLLDRQLDIRFVNRFALDYLGCQHPDALLGTSFRDLLPADAPLSASFLAQLLELPQQASSRTIEADILHQDGSSHIVSWSVALDASTTGAPASLILTGLDAHAIRACREAVTMFQTVSDNYTGSIVITDSGQRILYVNPAVPHMTGYTLGEILGKTPSIFKSGQTPENVYRNLWDTLDSGGIWRGEFINRRKDGGNFLESKTIAAIRDARGKEQYYFAIGEDLSQRQQYLQRIERLLVIDQQTGLPNRASFLNSLTAVLCKADASGHEVTVLHVDIDDFFLVNEAFGVSAADQLIGSIGERLREALRQVDVLARIGSDKFAILIGPHPAGIDKDIADVVERILATIRTPLAIDGKSIKISASIGIATYPEHSDQAGELLNHAAIATEQAKSDGGNRFCRFDATTASHAGGRHHLISELLTSIQRGEMVLYYQPQISLFSGSIVGLEALIRWAHPVRGLVPPGQFIPLIEQSQHIIAIGEWVLEETCRQMRDWLDQGLPPTKIAINMAARHFLLPDLHLTVGNALEKYQIAPHLLEIEITESAMMQDVNMAIRTTTQLKELGLRISLDDFGTGYSSLAYLSRFPIDVVKIDQSFVHDITINPINAAIAQATIAMSHKLGKIVLAEGVETVEQMQYLRRSSCDEMQGFFFSRPIPAQEVTPMIRDSAAMNLNSGSSLPLKVRHTILLVDDEPNILSALKRTLRREGYEILTAEGASAGFKLLATNDIQVVVSDQRMPEMNGTEFLSRVKNLYPQTVRMVLSGYSEITAVTDAINRGAVYRFLLKPWDDEKLKEEIAGAFRFQRDLYGTQDDE